LEWQCSLNRNHTHNTNHNSWLAYPLATRMCTIQTIQPSNSHSNHSTQQLPFKPLSAIQVSNNNSQQYQPFKWATIIHSSFSNSSQQQSYTAITNIQQINIHSTQKSTIKAVKLQYPIQGWKSKLNTKFFSLSNKSIEVNMKPKSTACNRYNNSCYRHLKHNQLAYSYKYKEVLNISYVTN
jgi:hypothetical protein